MLLQAHLALLRCRDARVLVHRALLPLLRRLLGVLPASADAAEVAAIEAVRAVGAVRVREIGQALLLSEGRRISTALLWPTALLVHTVPLQPHQCLPVLLQN